MNPYETNSDHIPSTDSYADVPLYGRYSPKPDDFRVHLQQTKSQPYWTSVIELCNESVRIYPADEGGRDVFALGSVIVKPNHLHDTKEIDYSYADANEVHAIDVARDLFKDTIREPEIYFAGKICGLFCFTPSMMHTFQSDSWSPGASPGKPSWRCLCVAWPYLKAVLQGTGTRNTSTAAYHQAQHTEPLTHCQISEHPQQRPIQSPGGGNPFLRMEY